MGDNTNNPFSIMSGDDVYHPVLASADNHNIANQEDSWYNPATIAKWGEASAVSGLLSAANSALAVGRWAGVTDKENYNISDTMYNLDNNLGDYYQNNKQLVDLSGFIATSLIPGMAGAKLAGAGAKALGAYMLGDIGEAGAASMGFAANMQQSLISSAVKTMGTTGTFSMANPQLFGALATGVAADYASGVAFMGMASAALNQSPIFDNMDAMDMAVNAFATSGLLLGGSAILRGVSIWSKASKEISALDKTLNEHRVSNILQEGASPADQIMAHAIDIKSRPAIDPANPNAALLQTTQETANKDAYTNMRKLALKLTDDNPVAARNLVEDTVNMQLSDIYANFPNLKSYTSVADEVSNNLSFAQRLFYKLRPDAVAKDANGKNIPLVNPIQAAEKELANGSTPVSIKLGELQQAGNGSLIINRATGQAQDSFLPLLGDTLKSGEKMSISQDGVQVGKTMYDVAKAEDGEFSVVDANRMDTEARYIWNMEAKPGMFDDHLGLSDEIPHQDLPTLERLLKEGEMTWDEPVQIHYGDGEVREFATPDLLAREIGRIKENSIYELRNASASNHEIAQRLNISEAAAADESLLSTGDINAANPDIFRMQNSVYKSQYVGETVKPYMEPTHYVARYEQGYKKQAEFALSTALGKQYLDMKEKAYQGVMSAVEQGIASAFNKAGLFPDAKLIDVGDATRMGAGGKLLAFASGAYRSVQAMVESIGSLGSQLSLARGTATREALVPLAQAVSNNKAALAEYNMLNTQIRRAGVPLKFLGQGAIESAPDSAKLISTKALQMISEDAKANKIELNGLSDAYKYGVVNNLFKDGEVLSVEHPATAQLLQGHVKYNTARELQRNTIAQAKGAPLPERSGIVYMPPIDYKKYPFYAFVRDDSLGGSGVSVITARTSQELQDSIAKVKSSFPEYAVNTAKDTKDFFEMQAAYDYDAAITSSRIDSNLRNLGVQNVFTPPTDSNHLLDELLNWHQGQETKLVRDFITAKYGAQFARIEALGQASADAAQSSWDTSVTNLMRNKQSNNWMDYRRTALFVPKNNNQILQTIDDTIQRATDGAWNGMRKIINELKYRNMTDADVAALNTLAKANGIGTPYADAASVALANLRVDRGVAKTFVGRVNGVLSNIMLGLDPFQALNNHLGSYILNSGEIKSVLNTINNDPRFADVQKLIQQKVPGTDIYQVSPGKLISKGISSFYSDEKGANLAKYQNLGLEMSQMQQLRNAVNDMSVSSAETTSTLAAKADKIFEHGRKLTGNNYVESFNRYISANIMDTLTAPLVKAGVMQQAEANAMMMTFVNRTHGNFLAAQRPQIFQGVVGSAISLYQTYQWNMMQQLFRYIGDGDKGAALATLGVQGSLYGLNGMPAFNTVNNLIATARGNPDHHDMFDTISSIGGRDKAEWLLYGLGSNALGLIHPDLKTNLYSRGDINPRSWTVLPNSPADIPAVSQTAKMLGTIKDTFNTLADGGAVAPTILQGIEHLGLNRPLSGFAQALNGRSTTNAGQMLSAVDMGHLDTYIRFLGGKPMNEAIYLDAIYRNKAFAQETKDRVDTLGAAIRSKVAAGQAPTQEDMEKFNTEYISAKGTGDPAKFQQFYAKELAKANQSVANQIVMQNKNSSISKYVNSVMFGRGLPDPASVAASSQTDQE